MTITTIPWIVVLAFGAFFIFAATREILHRRKHGPPENPRDVFEFDEDAPSYEEPEPLPEETSEETAEAETETGAGDDPSRKEQPDGKPPSGQDDPDSTDTDPTDRNGTSR